ncbi:MAG: asparagine--tRNA ligase [Candidatus Woesearchaeota archaeon]
MKFISIQEAITQGKGKVAVRGWVYRERKQKELVFIVLRDVSNIVQCVVKKEQVALSLWEIAQSIRLEASLKISGEIRPDTRAPTLFELEVEGLELVGDAEIFPITKDQSPEFLLDKRHLWLRSRRLTAIMKIRSTVVGAIHKFFRERGYFEFDPPILQPMQCEGGSTLFEVKYYQNKTYLTQSWQLYAEAAIFALEKVYDMSPTFRAEKSKTSRHLSEFWMAEMEAAWMELDECVQVAKDELRFIVKEVLKTNKAELEILGRDLKKLQHYAEADYPTITYTEAIDLLNKKYKMQVPWGKDLRTLEEAKIADHFKVPVAVTHYPTAIMGFYKPPTKENPKVAMCFDVLAPEGYCELVGGSQRSLDIENMKKRLEADGENIDKYQWYFDLRRFGSVPHSGYGMGVERVIAWICGLDNIKDAIPFPRTMLRWDP